MSTRTVFIVTMVLVLLLVPSCGSGGGTSSAIEPEVEALRDPALIGDWELVGFDVWDFTTGDYWNQHSFGWWSGTLALYPDGSGQAQLCIESFCADVSFRWAARQGRFEEGAEVASYHFENDILVLDWSGTVQTSGHRGREVKRFRRVGNAAAAYKPSGMQTASGQNPIDTLVATLSSGAIH